MDVVSTVWGVGHCEGNVKFAADIYSFNYKQVK
jgi:hypothetical protein